MKTGKILRLIVGTLSFLLIHSVIYAEPSVSAKVNTHETTLNGSVTLVVEISGVNNVGAAPNLAIPDFQVQRAGQTSSFQWINGQSSSLTSFNYILVPLKIGTFQIPAVTLNVDGKSYNTEPIQIVVKSDPGGNQQGQTSSGDLPNKSIQVPSEGIKPVFMTASVDTSKAYVGQQILLRVQFLRRPDIRLLSQPRYVEPDMTGFLVEPLKQQEYMTTLNGTQYAVTEIPYALFPTSDGEFTVGSGQIELAVRRQADPFDPDSFFQSFFGRGESARLSTRAIPIQVRALPKNKPVSFSGTVGRFKISAKADEENLEVGKPFNLILTIEGVGNVNSVKEPFIPDLRGFRRYETISASNIIKDGKFLHGKKDFKILLIPQVSGPLTIPPIPFVYFNPSQNDYVTELTNEISLMIKPGTLNQTEPDVIAKQSGEGNAAEGIQVVEKDIRFVKSGKISPVTKPALQTGWFVMAATLPPLFSFVAFLAQLQTRKKREQPSLYRYRQAFSKSKLTLKKIKKGLLLSSPEAFYGLIFSTVTEFLADKFGVSATGLKWDEIERRLLERKIEPSMISQVKEILDESDMARFATSSFDDRGRDNIIKKIEALLLLLNKTI